MSQTLTRIVRTVSSYVWAWIALRLVAVGVTFTDAQSAAVEQAIVIVLGAVIYAAITYAAKRWPMLEWLLGVPKSPVYVHPLNAGDARDLMRVKRL